MRRVAALDIFEAILFESSRITFSLVCRQLVENLLALSRILYQNISPRFTSTDARSESNFSKQSASVISPPRLFTSLPQSRIPPSNNTKNYLIIIHTTLASENHASESFFTTQQSSTGHANTPGERLVAAAAAHQNGVIVSCSTDERFS